MKIDGGPAFPQITGEWSDIDYSEGKHLYKGGEYEAKGGMSLRDWFAGMATHEDLVIPETQAACAAMLEGDEYITSIHYPRVISIARYRYADAMIAERSKEDHDGQEPTRG